MAGVFRFLLGRASAWLDRVVEADPRYICAACDDRFPNHALGAEHVWRCHPEYEGVVIAELAAQKTPLVPRTQPARLPLPQAQPALRTQHAWS